MCIFIMSQEIVIIPDFFFEASVFMTSLLKTGREILPIISLRILIAYAS